MVLGAAEGLHPLAGGGGRLVDVPRHGRGAHEAHRVDQRVGEQRVDHLAVALQHREDPRGQPGLREHLGEEQRRAGVALGGLEDEGVAARERHRDHPQRHHGGEVERRDPHGDAHRLEDRRDVDAARRLLGVRALQQGADAARELDDLEPPLHLTEGVGPHLAVLAGDDLGHLVGTFVEQLAEPEQHLGPLAERGRAPVVGRVPRPPDHGGRVGCGGEAHGRDVLARGRVAHRRRPLGGAGPGGAVVPVVDGGEHAHDRLPWPASAVRSASMRTPVPRSASSMVSDSGGATRRQLP